MPQSDNGRQNFAITLDNSQLRASATESRNILHSIGSTAAQEGANIDNSFSKIAKAAGGVFALGQLKQFASEIVRVRGEIESLEISFETLLGNREKGQAMFNDIRQFAVSTPMMLKDLASGAQTMLAFNIEAEKVMPMLKAIGDISMGDAQKFNSLTLAFSQMSATGRLMGQDLLQMINAGFNPLSVISEKTGKSIGELKDEMEKGKISAGMITEAFISATSEGGKFHGMLEKQSHGIKGAISNLQGSIDDMLNTMGENSQGVITSSIDLLTLLAKNYETVGEAVIALVAICGTYKAALIALEMAEVQKNLASRQGLTISTAQAIRYAVQARATDLATKATARLNATMLANPYALAAAAAVAFLYALYKLITYEDKATKAAKEAEAAHRKMNEVFAEGEANIYAEQESIRQLFDALKSASKETKEYSIIKDKIIQQYGKYLQGLIDEKNNLIDIEKAYHRVAIAAREAAKERTIEEAANEVRNDFAGSRKKHIDEIYEKLQARAPQMADTLMQLINTEMSDRGFLSDNTKRMINRAFGVGNDNRRRLGFSYDKDVEEIYEAALNIRNCQRVLDETLKEINVKYGDVSNKYAGLNPKDLQASITSVSDEMWENMSDGYDIIVGGKVVETIKSAEEAQIAIYKMMEAMESTSTTAAPAEIQNKKYWEDIAKSKKEEYEAMSEAKQASEEGQRIKKEWEEAQKKAKKMSIDAGKNSATASAEKRRQKKEAELVNDTEQAIIDAMEDGYEKRIKQIALDRKKAYDELNETTKDLTKNDQVQNYINEKSKQIEHEYNKSMQQAQQDQIDSMRVYLKEYGSLMQQKLAITEEYNDKIAKATSEGERLSLTKERDSRIAKLNQSGLTLNIDWANLIKGIRGLAKDTLEPMLAQIEAYMKGDEFKSASMEDKTAIIELYESLRASVGAQTDSTWKDLAESIAKFSEEVSQYNQLKEKEASAYSTLNAAKKQLSEGKITQEEFDAIKSNAEALSAAVESARKSTDAFAINLNNLSQQIAAPISKLTTALTNAGALSGMPGLQEILLSSQSIDALKGALDTSLSTMKEGLARDIGSNLSDIIGKATGGMGSIMQGAVNSGAMQLVGIVGQIPKMILQFVDAIKGFVTGVLDNISTLLEFKWINDLVDSILDAVAHLIDTIIDLPENLVNMIGKLLGSVKGFVGDLLNTVSFGGFDSLFGANGNAKEINEANNRLRESNENLATQISRLTDEISKYNGAMSIRAYHEAVEAARRSEENYRKILDNEQRYSNSHHSNSHYWNMGDAFTAEVNRLLGTALRSNRWDDWANLTADQMNMIRTYLPEVWTAMKNQGKYGERNGSFEDYADQAGKVKELTDQINAALIGMDFSSLRDNFISQLMDMESDAADFADSFKEMMQKSLLNSMIGNRFDEEMQKWYDELGEALQSANGELSEDQIEYFRQQYDDLVNSLLALRDEASKLTGYTGESENGREASQKGIASASQDSVDELNGRATAIQGHTFSIMENTKLLASTTASILQSVINIDHNTESIPVRLAAVEEGVSNIEDTLNDIALKGVKIR